MNRSSLLPPAGVGLAMAAAGGVVLATESVTGASTGWFAYGAAPSAVSVGSLTVWSGTRAAGAVLLVLGVMVLATILGLRIGRAHQRPVRGPLLLGTGFLSAALVVGGAAAFAAPTDPMVTYQAAVWTRSQLISALVVTVGVLLACAAVGLLRGRRAATTPSPQV